MSKEKIFDAAYAIAESEGFGALKRNHVAKQAGVANGSVQYYWGSLYTLHDTVVEKAIEEKNYKILAGAIAVGNDVAKSAPRDVALKAVSEYLF